MKVSNEEIELCRKIAEKERRDIEYGDWSCDVNYSNEIRLLHGLDRGKIHARSQKELNVFFLWTLSDCLEWLREKGFQTFLIMELAKGWGCDGYIGNKIYQGEGNSILEACLKAVLAVLEDK